MRGVYLVAAELTRVGLIASTTSRSAVGADILATDPACSRTFAIQVKTNAKSFGFWLLSAKAKQLTSQGYFYVFVNLKSKGVEYFVVPSRVVSEHMKSSVRSTGNEWHQFDQVHAEPYREKWSLLDVGPTIPPSTCIPLNLADDEPPSLAGSAAAEPP
jgi:hypothetical protein